MCKCNEERNAFLFYKQVPRRKIVCVINPKQEKALFFNSIPEGVVPFLFFPLFCVYSDPHKRARKLFTNNTKSGWLRGDKCTSPPPLLARFCRQQQQRQRRALGSHPLRSHLLFLLFLRIAVVCVREDTFNLNARVKAFAVVLLLFC